MKTEELALVWGMNLFFKIATENALESASTP